ncbi:MAG: tripartite tricarboxylate transporter TctB family protein [Candidatus Rokubacteria bacterium]|nr:tripartite tricarboxylate transporter TctB family protein [Candidatus Rokubacteria bacterium]
MRSLRGAIGPALIFLAGAGLFAAAGRLPVVPVPGQLGPDFWPRLILIGLMASCVLKILEVARGREGRREPTALLPLSRPKLAGGMALVLGYPALAPLLGFPLTTFFFLLAFMRLAGMRRPLPLLATTLLGTVALLYVFVKVVYLPLPKGAGVMEDFTIFLYRLLRIF